MTRATRRRRAGLLLALALACGGLAASEVNGLVRDVEGRVGAPVPVLVAARDIAPGTELSTRDVAVREVPRRFAPPDAFADPPDVAGAVPVAPLARGSYLTAAALGARATESERGGVLRRGERAVEVGVAGVEGIAGSGASAGRVDVLVSTEPRDGAGRTFLALQDVELLDLRGADEATAADPGDEGAPSAAAVATLRVTLRQAVYLTAAGNFAREVRLLARPPGDRGRSGRQGVAADAL